MSVGVALMVAILERSHIAAPLLGHKHEGLFIVDGIGLSVVFRDHQRAVTARGGHRDRGAAASVAKLHFVPILNCARHACPCRAGADPLSGLAGRPRVFATSNVNSLNNA